ncbi:MAG: helix-turn-helix transcriptional regulator [Clostridia bacterium]|nr:helix-turn-helix transcriptional regulator [Clostridia bacterium]
MKKENRKKDSETARLMRSIIAKTQLTNEQVAEKADVSVRMVYHYLSGRSEPSMRVYIKLIELAK